MYNKSIIEIGRRETIALVPLAIHPEKGVGKTIIAKSIKIAMKRILIFGEPTLFHLD
jgi:hypothetical protein